MDPVTLIVAALATGAAAAAKDVGGDAVKSAFNGLKALIAKKFSGKLTVITANLPLLLFVVMLLNQGPETISVSREWLNPTAWVGPAQ